MSPDGGDGLADAALQADDAAAARDGAAGLDLATDPANCGTKGHDCLGGACAAGLCQAVDTKIGTLVEGPYPGGNQVYAVVDVSGDNFKGIVRVPASGGAPARIASAIIDKTASPTLFGGDLGVVDGGFLFANYRYTSSGQSMEGILRADLNSGAVTKVVDAPSSIYWRAPFALDAAYLYWSDDAGLHRRPRAGGATEAYAQGVITGRGQRMASDADALYLGIGSDLVRLRKTDLQKTTLATLTYDVAAISLDDDNVVAMSKGGITCNDLSRLYPTEISVVRKDGSAPKKRIADNRLFSSIAAAGSGRVYWHDNCSGSVHLSTATTDVVLATGQPGQNEVVAHVPGAVFWSRQYALWKRAE